MKDSELFLVPSHRQKVEEKRKMEGKYMDFILLVAVIGFW